MGGGSGGAVVASRLAENRNHRVLLFEAGPDYGEVEALPEELRLGRASGVDHTTQGHTWGYSAELNSAQPPIEFPQGRVLGGTSAINGQMFLRALPGDFEMWAGLGIQGWTYDDVLPFYTRVESDLDFADRWHGSSGPIQVRRYATSEWLPPQVAFVKACRSGGFDYYDDQNSPLARGVGAIPFNNVGGVRASSAITYLCPSRRPPNLTIAADTRVRRLLMSGDGSCHGVVIGQGSRGEVFKADRYVIAAGAIGTPRLLMLSGIGQVEPLKAAGISVRVALDGVGANLGDHPIVDLAWQPSEEMRSSPDCAAIQVHLRCASGMNAFDDLRIYMRNRFVARSNAPQRLGELVGMSVSVDMPTSSGQVRLNPANPDGPPSIDLRLLATGHDLDVLSSGVQMAQELAGSAAFDRVFGNALLPRQGDAATPHQFRSWLRRHVSSSHHAVGTCRMGPDTDPMSVTDSNGRVHGLQNVWVADASLLPLVPRANPNATVMMVGERIAHNIANAS